MSRKKAHEHKGQHWVAASYLSAWCDRTAPTMTPSLWRFDKDGTNAKRKSPQKTFLATDLYTFQQRDGERDLGFEKLMGKFETAFATVRHLKLKGRLPLTPDDRGAIICFMAAQLVRTPLFRDHWERELNGAMQLAEELTEKMKDASPERKQAAASPPGGRGSGASFTLDQMQAMRDHPFQVISPHALVALMKIFDRMELIMFSSDDPIGFVTSDAPCVVFDPDWYEYPPLYRGPALAMESTEVSMPLAPDLLAVLTYRKGLSGYLGHQGTTLVDEYNRRTRLNCERFFVSRLNQTKPVWFDPGEPLAEWWWRTHGSAVRDESEQAPG